MNKPLRRVAMAMMTMIVLLLANVTYVQVIQANEYKEDSRNKRTLYEEYSHERGQIIADGQSLAKSVKTEDDTQKYLRQYPQGAAFAPVTGFYSFVYGSNGIERAKDDILNGTDDSMAFNRLSDTLTGKDPRGGNVELTVDPAVQKTAYEQLTSKGYEGSVVALNPSSGEILGMANSPSYNPDDLSTHDRNEAVDAWQGYEDEPNSPMTNRAVSETYPPGSVFKLITTAAALENGYNPNSNVEDAAKITLPNTDTQLPNYGGAQCQGDTLTAALAHSCNTAFAKIAGDVGADKLREKAGQFGFGKNLNIPMEIAKSDMGPMSDKASEYQSGIGQRDVRVTPMQNAMMAAAVANDGKVMKPQLVESTRAPDMSELEGFEPQQLSEAMSPEVAGQIREMMLQSEGYTSGSGKISGVEIASKTGTAQHGEEGDPHGWYVAFAPAENPQIAVAVLVENGGDEGQEATGGSISAPIGREVIRAGLQGGG